MPLLVLRGCKTWSVTFNQELRLRVFEKGMPRKIFGPKEEEPAGEWGIKLPSEEPHFLFSC